MTYVYIGYAPMFILFMFVSYKKLRNTQKLKILVIPSLIFAIIGIVIKTPEATAFATSFFYIVSYGFLRYLYLRKYGMEPTYYRYAWYDPEEGRKQNWLDVVVFAFPLFFSLAVPVALMVLKTKGF